MMTAAQIPEHVPPDLVRDIDYLGDPALKRDAHAFYDQLRNGPPVVYTPRNGGHWIVTRHAEIADVFKTPESFSNFPRIIPKVISAGAHRQPFSDIDPPDNLKYRRLLQQVMGPRSVARFEEEARRIMRELAVETAPRGACEFSTEIAAKLPIFILMRWLDLPMEDRFQLMGAADKILGHPDPNERKAAKLWIYEYVDAIVHARRETPGDDLISHLVNGAVDDRRVTHEEGRAMSANLIVGGLDTVRNMMSFIALFLAQNPEHRRRLAKEPALVPAAIEEMLRWAAVANMGRSVVRDIEFHGVAMKAGDMVLLPLALAGRDDAAFPEAAKVDFAREPNRHISFGIGAHLCPGMHLARIELRIFLEEWLAQIPDFALDPAKPPVTRGGIILAVESLPLIWTLQAQ
jgi:cytochrome P450